MTQLNPLITSVYTNLDCPVVIGRFRKSHAGYTWEAATLGAIGFMGGSMGRSTILAAGDLGPGIVTSFESSNKPNESQPADITHLLLNRVLNHN
jgi:hypothetical protein